MVNGTEDRNGVGANCIEMPIKVIALAIAKGIQDGWLACPSFHKLTKCTQRI